MAYIITQEDTNPIGVLHPRRVKMMMGEVTPAIPVKPTSGNGYLAGEFPGGTTTVEGAPVQAEVRILYRPAAGALGDGVVVAKTQSAPDGTWRVDWLDTALKYDVVGRLEDHNDVIVANVTPTSMVDITYVGAVVENETFTSAVGFLELVGGIPPYAASVVDPLPAGLFPVVNGRQLIIDGTTTDDDVFNSTVRITSSNGATKDVPVKLVVGFKAPANFEAETIEDAGAFSVVLTWEVTNTTQEVLVFKSTTPFDLESMPAPIATLSGDAVSYTDDDVIEDDVFYYMTASVCENYTLYSDEVIEVVAGDPHWDNVVSLLHFDKVPLSADAKGKLWTITNSTNVELSTEVQKFGNAVRFGRSGSGYLRADASSEHDLGADDFTIEFWMYKPSPINQNGGLVDFRSIGTRPISAPTLYLNASSGGRVTYYEKGSILIQTAPIPANTWIHIALCRLGNLITMYENGLAVGTTTKNDSFLTNLPITIGRVGDDLNSNDYYFRGYLDEVRITKGVARYTEDFTPPTEPFPNN